MNVGVLRKHDFIWKLLNSDGNQRISHNPDNNKNKSIIFIAFIWRKIRDSIDKNHIQEICTELCSFSINLCDRFFFVLQCAFIIPIIDLWPMCKWESFIYVTLVSMVALSSFINTYVNGFDFFISLEMKINRQLLDSHV